MSTLHLVTQSTLDLLAANVPDPGQGEPPPGWEKFVKLLSWGKWICLGVVVAGVLGAGAAMAWGGRHGEGGQHVAKLGWAAAGAIVIGSAGLLVGGLA